MVGSWCHLFLIGDALCLIYMMLALGLVVVDVILVLFMLEVRPFTVANGTWYCNIMFWGSHFPIFTAVVLFGMHPMRVCWVWIISGEEMYEYLRWCWGSILHFISFVVWFHLTCLFWSRIRRPSWCLF